MPVEIRDGPEPKGRGMSLAFTRSRSRRAQDCYLLRSVRQPVLVSLRPRPTGPVLVASFSLGRVLN
jgi:hypothetical protein